MSQAYPAMITLEQWHCLLRDVQSLLQSPRKHHRELLHQAYALRDAHTIDAGTLAEMLELADEALVHAHEVLADQHW
ncbi:hypothetical protein [Pseudomonas mosselii]|uniref:hypothetical protein n=1 Tax=Pseudomonas mosselii TaxID=78327 RepID=UPI001E447126|nr:hypothetical protein [Pseudomonas mosselii]WJR28868.1 hypothetical protein LU678_002050 [Pseudomonas mosselii]